jgi:hypothetical protein
MRIENYALNLEANAQKTEKKSVSFEDRLIVENSKRVEEMKSVEDELEFTKKLQYELLNELMSLLNNKRCGGMKFNSFDTSVFEQRELSYRELSIKESYSYSQSLDVKMCGVVQSTDKKIELDINLSFSSEFTQTYSIDKTMFYDPLVINFDSELPELDSKSFSFDIDMDGKKDQISMLKSGSGFLALDRDENGKIDDGYELFGTQNGNGFLDLKRYDDDSNGWIDENDDIFNKLRIWSKTEDSDELIALGEAGVGALYLGYAKGDYDLKDNEDTLGRVRSNGLFLNEDGRSGLLTQIDFAKHKDKQDSVASPLQEALSA